MGTTFGAQRSHVVVGVVIMFGADAGVGFPEASVPAAVISYVVPGARLARVQS